MPRDLTSTNPAGTAKPLNCDLAAFNCAGPAFGLSLGVIATASNPICQTAPRNVHCAFCAWSKFRFRARSLLVRLRESRCRFHDSNTFCNHLSKTDVKKQDMTGRLCLLRDSRLCGCNTTFWPMGQRHLCKQAFFRNTRTRAWHPHGGRESLLWFGFGRAGWATLARKSSSFGR